MKRATSLAANILDEFSDQLPGGVTLLPSSGGVFEVSLGDQLIFSKERRERFPQENEVEEKLEELLET